MRILVGDWVRFYRNGALVIGVVSYVKENAIHEKYAVTDMGEVEFEDVLERRSGSGNPATQEPASSTRRSAAQKSSSTDRQEIP